MTKPTMTDTCISMLEKGADRNFVEAIAYESGIDFDHKTDGSDEEFSNNNNQDE